MKETYSIGIDIINPTYPQRGGIPSDVFAAIATRVPDQLTQNGNSISPLPGRIEKEDIKRILDTLSDVGIDIMDAAGMSRQAFSLTRLREYDKSDLDESACFTPNMNTYLGETTDNNEYDDRGIPYLKAAVRPYKKEFGQVARPQGAPCLVVRGKVKDALEKSGLRGLRLVEPLLKGRKQLKPEEMVWVVWSEFTLPPMKNVCYDNAGERFRYADRKSFPKGSMVFEGYFGRPAEIHYRREALAKLGEFDIALTVERFGGIGALQPYVIMSQRFRRFIEDELGMEMTGTPVRVDHDDTIPWGGPYPEPWEHLNERPDWLKKLESKF